MGRLFILYYDDIPDRDCVHCRLCGIRIAFIRHHFANISNDIWIVNEVFNVEVPEDESYHEVLSGNTLAETYCIKCQNLLGFKLVAVPQPTMTLREGKFIIILGRFGPVEQGRNNGDGGANVQNANQNGDANEQDVGANEQNSDQDEGANEHTDEQDVEANEQNADQDEGTNEHIDEQDVGTNEQNADQDEGPNEHNDEQDGGAMEYLLDLYYR